MSLGSKLGLMESLHVQSPELGYACSTEMANIFSSIFMRFINIRVIPFNVSLAEGEKKNTHHLNLMELLLNVVFFSFVAK